MRLTFCKIGAVLLLTIFGYLTQVRPGMLRVVFCDVGQGDAILLIDGSKQVLVDTGQDQSILHCLEESLPFWDKTLDLVVLTHPDYDHIGGFLSLAEQYEIDGIMYLPLKPDTRIAEQVLEEIHRLSANNTEIYLPIQGMLLKASPRVQLEVINPFFPFSLVEECKIEITETSLWDKKSCFLSKNIVSKYSKNNLSIALNVHIGDVTMFLSGDLESEAELALIAAKSLHRVDILKVGHHGAKTGTTKEILEVLQPERAIVSVGKNNNYSHPSSQVLQRLEGTGSRVYRTDQLGSIEFLLK
ncbi:MBL fold metallo-hydrolase [Candidatus Woesebacteria bacterium]|nr:MBL fold metallo-hydrolase [Candidatus Woesebacteria bacterium]